MDKLPSDRASSWFLPPGGEWPEDAVEQDFVVVTTPPGHNYDNFNSVPIRPVAGTDFKDGQWEEVETGKRWPKQP